MIIIKIDNMVIKTFPNIGFIFDKNAIISYVTSAKLNVFRCKLYKLENYQETIYNVIKLRNLKDFNMNNMGIIHVNIDCKHTNPNGVEPFQDSDLIALFTSDKIIGQCHIQAFQA